MAEKDLLIKEKLEHTGLFSFDDFYAFAYTWFKDESYGVTEEKYSEKHSGGAKEITVEWKCAKGMSDYFKIEIGVKFETRGLTDVEVESDGKKKKTNKGTVSVEIKGALIQDPSSKWNESPTYTFMRELYAKYLIPGRVDTMEDAVKGNVRDFKEKLKIFLESTGRR
ncbi:hypothetical protein EXS73_02410 [Candidatus Pacearchaeota archaeon]|nr:hypothetical protein [Candidatus Pacearchaeota archaeon]